MNKNLAKITLMIFLISPGARASGLDECGSKGNAPIWAALNTPGFIVDQNSVSENIPFKGSKIYNAAALGYDRIVLQEMRKKPQATEAAKALVVAATTGRLTTTATLIGAGVSPNAEIDSGFTPLYAAAGAGCSEEVRYLVAMGANVNHHAGIPQSILEIAIMTKYFAVAKTLLDLGYKATDSEKETVKEILAREGRVDLYPTFFSE